MDAKIISSSFCIYGAGIVATSIYKAIQTIYGRVPAFFLVSDTTARQGIDENPREIDGIPVKTLSAWREELQKGPKRDPAAVPIQIPTYYLIAVPERHHPAVVEALHALAVEDGSIFLFTNQRENELMERYYSSLSGCDTVKHMISAVKESGADKADSNIPGGESICVYQARSHMDKILQEQCKLPSYVTPIQAGAALAEQRIADVQDNTGDNISAKNRNYCELTATYHAWKHCKAAYKGICHYSRVFDISEEQMGKLLQTDDKWDVILPYPTVHYPDISAQHTRWVRESDWNAMLQALGQLEPEYLKTYEESVLTGEQFFHNYNMLIAKAEVFDDYCGFLFRVLERTECLATPRGWERADRFAGYLGENLTTLYFLHNRNRWKAAYAGKIWLT